MNSFLLIADTILFPLSRSILISLFFTPTLIRISLSSLSYLFAVLIRSLVSKPIFLTLLSYFS
jgi:hypothetical protein